MRGILIDEKVHDLVVVDGCMVLGDTASQTVEAVLLTAPGEWKEHPLLGADARSRLGGNIDRLWANQTKNMIRSCGVGVTRVTMSEDGVITIE